jgi:hypothetical protein
MDEAHLSKLSIYHGSRKMYQELRPHYWWTKMKKEITTYVARCNMDWKWDDISMDFIFGVPTTQKGNDSIWVIINHLTKSAHFLPVKTMF